MVKYGTALAIIAFAILFLWQRTAPYEAGQSLRIKGTFDTAMVTDSGPQKPSAELPFDFRPAELDAGALAGATSAEQAALRYIHFRFNSGDYGATLTLIEAELARPGLTENFRTWLVQQLPIVLVSKGWLLVGAAECERAVMLFERAESLQPVLEAKKGLGLCYHRLGRFPEAQEVIGPYLVQKPLDLEMQVVYSDVLESRSLFREAFGALEAALAAFDHGHYPQLNREDLKARLDSMRAKADEGEWQLVTAGFYVQLTHHSSEDPTFIQWVIDALDQAVDWLVADYGFVRPGQLIEVVLYRDTNFQQMVAHGPDWAAGLFDGRMRVPVPPPPRSEEVLTSLLRVLRHELVHALLAQVTRGRVLPDWFNEGLAQRFECGRAGCGSMTLPAMRGAFLSQTAFEQRFARLSAMEARVAYQQSLMLVLTLEQDMNEEEALRRIVSQLERPGSLASDDLLAVIGRRFAELHSRAARNWQQAKRFSY